MNANIQHGSNIQGGNPLIPLTSNCTSSNRKKPNSKNVSENINYETISHNENIQHYSMERQLSMLCRDDIISYHKQKKTFNMKS